jgi:hypothetical protein
LDLVLIHASQRENYLRFVAGVLTGSLEDIPAVSKLRGSQVEIAWRGFPLHLDGEIVERLPWKEEEGNTPADDANALDVAGPYLQVKLIPKAVHFLVPRFSHAEEEG